MENKQTSQARTWIGILLIIFGILIFLDKTNILIITLPFEIFSWGGLVLLIGLIIFLTSGNRILGSLIMFLGAIFLYSAIWPIALIVLGLYLMLSKNKPLESVKENLESVKDNIDITFGASRSPFNDPNKIEDISIFGGGHKSYLIDNLTGGRAISIFGGSEIDLRGCRIAQAGCTIEVVSIFGGSTFQVPDDWNVSNEVVSIFGGFSDSRRKSPAIEYDSEKTIIYKGIVLFGGGEVK